MAKPKTNASVQADAVITTMVWIKMKGAVPTVLKVTITSVSSDTIRLRSSVLY